MSRLRGTVLGALALAPLAAQPEAPNWKTVQSEPEWVGAPPQRPGFYRYVTERRSNLQQLARTRAVELGGRDGIQHLTEHLTPILDRALATWIANTVIGERKAIRFAETFARRKGARGPGQTLATNWVLWEIPIQEALAAAPLAMRGRAERALLRPPPRWQDVSNEPSWVKHPTQRPGWVRIARRYDGQHHRDARTGAVAQARAGVRDVLAARLATKLPKPLANKAADAAVTDLHVVHRANWFRKVRTAAIRPRAVTSVWILWEVPISRMQRAVPAAQRESIAGLFEPAAQKQPGPQKEKRASRAQLVQAGRYADGSVRGHLKWQDGASLHFHLDVTQTHCRLFEGGGHRTDAGARLVAIGSARETEILRAIDAALQSQFDAPTRRAILAAERFRHDRDKRTWEQYLAGQVLRGVHRYRELTGARITTILVGKGTVRLSLKVEVPGAGQPQLFTFRAIDKDKLRLHAADRATPIALGSAAETRVKLAIGVWLRTHPRRDAKTVALTQVYGDYRKATSPRLQRVMALLDGGSISIVVSDREDREIHVRFDRSLNTKTPGRMFVKWRAIQGLVELGSEREKRLLVLLDRAVGLAAEMPARRADAKILAGELEAYRSKFRDK